MRFLPKEICEKLVEIGCESKSGFYYGRLRNEPDHKLSSLTKEQITEIDCLWYDVGYDGGLIVKRVGPYLLSDGMNIYNQERDMVFCIPIFALSDFVETEEYAKENCRKAFGVYHICGTASILYAAIEDYHRHAIIVSPDWIDYLSKAIKK